MEAKYYLFAVFVFALICAAIFLCHYLFSDIRRQKKMLDDKEAKLLRLYQSLEDVMEEFSDSVNLAGEDIKAQKEQMARQQQELYAYMKELRLGVLTEKEEEIKAGAEPQNEVLFKDYLAEYDQNQKTEAKEEEPQTAAHGKNRDKILAMAAYGQDRLQIARELNITLNEVDLVLEMTKN